ncbi:MAG: calcium-binding protein [Pseudomonadota bacterium]
MTTYTVTGFSTFYNQSLDIIDVAPVQLAALLPTDPPVFQYTVLSGAGTLDQVNVFTPETLPLSFTVNGQPGSFNWELTIAYVDTAAGRSYIMLFYDPVVNVDHAFLIGGAALPLPTDVASMNAFLASITGGGVVTSGPFAPDTDINVLAIPNVGSTENDLFPGTAGVDEFDGGIGNDTIDGLAGNDDLAGGTGNDEIAGGTNDDTLDGGAGADTLDGGDGFDTASFASAMARVRVDLLNPGAALNDAVGDVYTGIEAFSMSALNDVFNGDNGQNWAYGLGGDDGMKGRGGRDRLFGDEGNDTLNGGKGRDRLEGGDGNDELLGLGGLDNLRGGKGDDTMEGGDGNDLLIGGRGSDVLDGGAGDDNLSGSTDADTFLFADGHGNDVITDFAATNDSEKIDLSEVSAINSIGDITDPGGAGSQVGSDVLIDTGGGDSILLQNVQLGDLGNGDFIF